MNYKKDDADEIFAKSFGAYSCSAVVIWLMRKYEYSEIILESPNVLSMILGVGTVGPVIIGLFLGGLFSVIGLLAITFRYFESHQKEIDPSPKLKWYYQIICFLCAFVFAWMLIVFGEKVLDQ